MSNLGRNSSRGNMSTPIFQEIKKQASFFLKEKIKTARLALTDVTPTQLLAEEATNGNPGGPDTRTLMMISKAAFEVDDYWRVVEILHERLAKFDRSNWRPAYKALIVLENLLTHGPESVAEEFQSDKDVIVQMKDFRYIDEKGFNWGLNVRKKSERILKLLENRTLLKEERNRARKITRGIHGFGSFSDRTSSGHILQETSSVKHYERCLSQFNDHGNREDPIFSSFHDQGFVQTWNGRSSRPATGKTAETYSDKKMKDSSSWRTLPDQMIANNASTISSCKENMGPEGEMLIRDLDLNERSLAGESNPLLGEQEVDSRVGNSSEEEDHPFSEFDHRSTASLLSAPERTLEAC